MSADLIAAFAAPNDGSAAPGRAGVGVGSSVQERQDPDTLNNIGVTRLFRTTSLRETHPDISEDTHRHSREPGNPDVLFDALDDAESEVYGDFEVAREDSGQTLINASNGNVDPFVVAGDLSLRSLIDAVSSFEYLQTHRGVRKEGSDDDWGTFEDKEPTPKPTNDLGVAVQSPRRNEQSGRMNQVDDDLVELDDAGNRPGRGIRSNGAAQDAPLSQSLRPLTSSAFRVRPTNIPPPSRILQLLTSAFHELVLKCTVPEPSDSLLADEIICLYVTAARIIAGRSWRWKRDKILSQSMSIGPATSNASKGMKLRSVNRNELVKEDQEVVESIRNWAKSSHLYNSTIARAHKYRHLQLSATLSPKKSQGPGVLLAGHACALCGLLRDERLASIDEDASDLFGEYWAEHWGHMTCMSFWDSHQYELSKE